MFQEFKLMHGTWDVTNPDGDLERVRPQDIKHSALLTVEGELDDISGSGQTRAAHDLCKGIAKAHQQHLEVAGAGHYGIFSGRRWREVVYPCVREFIASHHEVAVRAANKRVRTSSAKALGSSRPASRKTAARKTTRRSRA